MSRQQIVETLRAHHRDLSEQFQVASLALFGSASRDELSDDGDVDLLVSFQGDATFDGYFALKRHLEGLLNRPVDLVTPKSLKPRLRRTIERELIHVA